MFCCRATTQRIHLARDVHVSAVHPDVRCIWLAVKATACAVCIAHPVRGSIVDMCVQAGGGVATCAPGPPP